MHSSPQTANSVAGISRTRQTELIVQSIDQLPTLSPVAARVLRLSKASDEGFDEVIKLIEADPALSAKILSLCRRAATGMGRSISTVRRAAVMLGWEAVQAAVLSVQVYELLQHSPGASEQRDAGAPGTGFDAPGFWKHSIAVAAGAELIASTYKHLKVSPEEAFVAGLVHDLGKLALDWTLPKTYAKVIELAETRRLPLASAERQIIGLDHHQAGKRLAEHWTLPLSLQDAMWLHSQPPAALPPSAAGATGAGHRALVGIVAVANQLARHSHVGWSPGLHDVRASEQWAAALGLTETQINEIGLRLHDSVAERAKLLGLGEQSGHEMLVQSLSAANRRLAQLTAEVQGVARGAADYKRAVTVIGAYAEAERPAGTLLDTLERLAQGWRQLTGRAPLAMICQVRRPTPGVLDGAQGQNEDWRLACFNDEGAPTSFDTASPLISPDGGPVDLGTLVGAGELGDNGRLLRWLGDHAPRTGAEGAAGLPVAPRWSRCAATALVSALGPAAVIIHDPDAPLPAGPVREALTGFWAWALAASAQGEGLRRLAEQMATAARELADAKERLAEHESMARLGEFTSGAAHELNNPLTVISGRAQVLADKLKGQRHEDDARAIVRACDNMTDLITQLHMVSCPPAARAALIDVREAAEAGVAEARRRTGVMLPVQVEAPELLTAELDRAGVVKVIAELVSNALQASPRSAVLVRLSASGPSAHAMGGTLTLGDTLSIEVHDDGRGMSERTRRHAFDPFFSEQPAGRGHGLGLPLARRIVQTLGGSIELTSQPSRGTLARVTLPINPGARAEAAQDVLADGPESGPDRAAA
jgi:signal transduction histidine kinase/HD-like signal output (HDOD) protein